MLLSKATYSASRLYMFCMCVPWELNLQPFALLTQCSTTEPQEHFLIMNRKQEGPCMGTRGRETQDMGTQVWHNPPPPNRRVPRHTTSNGEGGWALWRPQGTWSLDRWPIPGPTAEQGAWAAMVYPGTWVAMVDTGTTWAMAGSPPKKFIGEIAVRGGPREAQTLGTALVGAAEERPLETRALEARILVGTLEAWILGGAL